MLQGIWIEFELNWIEFIKTWMAVYKKETEKLK
jgi:hypothetical protein